MRKVPRLPTKNGSQVTWILRVHVAVCKQGFHFTIPRLREVPRLPAETEPIVKQDVPLYDPAGAESTTPAIKNGRHRKVGVVF